MEHFVYKTTNKKDGKIYVGVHFGNADDEKYLGSGRLLKLAILKHGRDMFSREILSKFDTRLEALDYERSIVNEEFILRPDTYNMKEGGCGNTSEDTKRLWKVPTYRKKVIESSLGKMWDDTEFQKRRVASCKTESYRNNHSKVMKAVSSDPKVKTRLKQLVSKNWKNESHRNKIKNSTKQFMSDTVFIHNDLLKENKRVKKNSLIQFIDDGWVKGLKKEYCKKN